MAESSPFATFVEEPGVEKADRWGKQPTPNSFFLSFVRSTRLRVGVMSISPHTSRFCFVFRRISAGLLSTLMSDLIGSETADFNDRLRADRHAHPGGGH